MSKAADKLLEIMTKQGRQMDSMQMRNALGLGLDQKSTGTLGGAVYGLLKAEKIEIVGTLKSPREGVKHGHRLVSVYALTKKAEPAKVLVQLTDTRRWSRQSPEGYSGNFGASPLTLL